MASSFPTSRDALNTSRTDATTMATNHAADHDNADDAINKIEAELLGPDGRMAIYNVEGSAFGAVPDQFYTDAVVPTAPGTKATVATQGILSGTGTGTFTISSGASYPTTSFNFALDNEVLTGSISGTTVTVTARGAQGTTAATHAVSASMYEAITSASAAFTGADVNKNIVFLRTGDASFLDQHTTVRSVLSSTAITVNNRSTRTAGVYSSIRFYISRSGNQHTQIQAAIDAAALDGGGIVFCPGVGYLLGDELVLKNRVVLKGAGMGATMLHLAGALSAKCVVRNDTTSNNSAMMCEIRDIHLDGNRDRQTTWNVTTTISTGASYTAGSSTTLDVTSAAGLFQGGGVITVGTNKLTYQDISYGAGASGTDRLTGVTGGNEGSTDANGSAGATVTQIRSVGVYFGLAPFNATPATAENFDPHFLVENVRIKYTGGDGIQGWGQSESRWNNIWCEQVQEVGFRPSFDSWIYNCTADGTGRMGFLLRPSSCQGNNNKSFYAGGLTAADGWGFFFEGYNGLEAGCKIFSSCNAQDNKAGGFWIKNAQRVFITGTADSNSTSAAGTYPALKIEGPGAGGTNGCVIDLVACDRNSSAFQQNALQIVDAGVANNQIRITHLQGTGTQIGTSGTAGASPQTNYGAAIKSGSVLTGGNSIQINSMGATRSPVFSATPTFDPYTATTFIPGLITAAVTAITISNAHYGCPLTIIWQQSATGFAVTIPATVKNAPVVSTTANAYTTWRLVYDGTNWVHQG